MFVNTTLSIALELITLFIYTKSFIRVIIRILMKENDGNSIFLEFPTMTVFGLYDKRTRLVNIPTFPIYTCQCQPLTEETFAFKLERNNNITQGVNESP